MRVLAEAVAAAAGLLVVLILLLIGVRAAALRRTRREQEFRLPAEAALGQYLAGTGAAPPPWTGGASGTCSWPLPLKRWPTCAARNATGWPPCCCGSATPRAASMRRLRARRTVVRRRAAESVGGLATPLAAPCGHGRACRPDLLVPTTCAVTLAETGSVDVLPSALAVAARDAGRGAGPGRLRGACGGPAQAGCAGTCRRRARASPAIRRIAVAVAADLRAGQSVRAAALVLGGRPRTSWPPRPRTGWAGSASSVPPARWPGWPPTAAAVSLARSAATEALGALGYEDTAANSRRTPAAPEWPVPSAAAKSLAGLGEPGAAVLRRAVAAGHPLMAPLAQAALHP